MSCRKRGWTQLGICGRKASWPPFHEIPEDGTSTRWPWPKTWEPEKYIQTLNPMTFKKWQDLGSCSSTSCCHFTLTKNPWIHCRYAIWSYDLDDGQWRRASPDLPNFRDKTLKTFTRGEVMLKLKMLDVLLMLRNEQDQPWERQILHDYHRLSMDSQLSVCHVSHLGAQAVDNVKESLALMTPCLPGVVYNRPTFPATFFRAICNVALRCLSLRWNMATASFARRNCFRWVQQLGVVKRMFIFSHENFLCVCFCAKDLILLNTFQADKDPLDVPQCSLALGLKHPPVVADPDVSPFE